MKKMMALLCLFLFYLIHLEVPDTSYADSAVVLPKGVFRTSVTGNFYLPVTQRFNEDGGTESVATDFNANLNSNIFPSLSLVEEGFGMPEGSATVGTSEVSFEYQFYDSIMEAQYGLTDRITIGFKLPYLWNRNSVDANINTNNATVGLNPYYGSPQDPFGGSPLVPLAYGGIPLTTSQTKALIGPGLDVNNDGQIDIPGYKYKPFNAWSGNGLGDLEVGFRYQYYNSPRWNLAFTGGVRFPTGSVDDPDNLVDVGYGIGAYALLFNLNQDYVGIKNLLLNGTIRYDLYLPDSITTRVPSDVYHPITTNEETVDRLVGSHFEFEGSGTYRFYDEFTLELMYRYAIKFKDSVSGNKGYNYSSLEDLTNWTYNLFKIGLGYSTIDLFKKKKFPLPVTVSFAYQNVFAGTNRYYQQQFFSLQLGVYF